MPSDIWLMPFHHDEVARDRNSKNVKDRCRHHLPLQISTFKNLVELVHLKRARHIRHALKVQRRNHTDPHHIALRSTCMNNHDVCICTCIALKLRETLTREYCVSIGQV